MTAVATFQLESLPYQTDAVKAVVGVFSGERQCFSSSASGDPLDLCIEMETGTGKTRWRFIFVSNLGALRGAFYQKFLSCKSVIWLESATTHPPHVLVSAKVLLQSRRAKGGFSFGAAVFHG